MFDGDACAAGQPAVYILHTRYTRTYAYVRGCERSSSSFEVSICYLSKLENDITCLRACVHMRMHFYCQPRILDCVRIGQLEIWS